MNEIVLSLWAKSVKNSPERLPLWEHALDVFNCFIYLDDFSNNDEVRNIAFLAAMHDIGKATPQYQKLNPELYQDLLNLGVKDEFVSEFSPFSGLASLGALFQIFDEAPSANRKRKLRDLCLCLNMHHGAPFKKSEADLLLKKDAKALGGYQWKVIRREFFSGLAELLDVDLLDYEPDMQVSDMIKYAGTTEVSDWIASDRTAFPYVGDSMTPEEYLPLSRIRALAAIESRGIKIRNSSLPTYKRAKAERIPDTLLQTIDNFERNSEPILTILQTPSNEYKLEAALRIASNLRSERGIFFAVPEGSVTEDLYQAFNIFLNSNSESPKNEIVYFKNQNDALLKYAQKIEYFPENEVFEDAEEGDQLFKWFLPHKRAFFANYGIGTIEETLFSSLNVKRFFLRLFGLAGKTVIFDDVGAHDIYLRQLFLRTLEWLRASGSDVVILTSALPGEFVKDILKSWDAKSFAPVKDYPYLIGAVAGGEASLIPFLPAKNQYVSIATPFETLTESAQRAAALAAQGHKVGVILNTVKRAQKFYKNLRSINPESEGFDLHLLHENFIASDKKGLESNALKEFGNPGGSGRGKILVATPIVDRRMRLYFDTVISDLAPIDLLIQRGRALTGGDGNPGRATLYVLAPDARTEGLAALSENTASYLQLFIYRTYAALEAKREWRCPEDCRPLVDTVYAPPPSLASEEMSNFPYSADRAAVEKALREYDYERTKARTKANYALIPAPQDMRDFFDYGKFEFRNESEALSDLLDMFGTKRPGARPENAFIVYKNRGEYYFDPELTEKIDKDAPIDENTVRGLLRNSIEIADQKIIKYLKSGSAKTLGAPPRCAKALENYKYLILDENRLYLDREYVKYDKELGLIVEGLLKS